MGVGLLPTVRVVSDTIVRVGMLNYSLVGVQPLWQALCNSRCFQYHHVLHSDLHCATEIYLLSCFVSDNKFIIDACHGKCEQS